MSVHGESLAHVVNGEMEMFLLMLALCVHCPELAGIKQQNKMCVFPLLEIQSNKPRHNHSSSCEQRQIPQDWLVFKH